MNTELRRRVARHTVELLHGQQWDLSTRSLATSGIAWWQVNDLSAWETVYNWERHCRHWRQRQSQVHLWHMHQPWSLNLWRSKPQVNQVAWRRQPKTTEKTAAVFIVGRLAIWKRIVRNWKLTRINHWWQTAWAHCHWTIPGVQHVGSKSE